MRFVFKKNILFPLALIPFFISPALPAQGFQRTDTIRVLNGSNVQLVNPWAGGHNFVQVSATDLDFDGIKDLVVFDRTANNPYDKITTYINIGTPNQVAYVHAPQYEKKFPPVHDWMFLVDYNGDGKEDLFTYHIGDFSVYKNTSGNGNLQFTLVKQDVKTVYDATTMNISLYVSPVDLPAFADVNNDGDIDVITYAINGLNVEYHQNMSMERYGNADSLEFRQYSVCFGHYTGNTNNCSLNLNACSTDTTRVPDENAVAHILQNPQAHSGNCLLCLDMDNDADKDLLNGGISCCSIQMLTNGGNTSVANMTSIDPTFPSTNVPVSQTLFPCPFLVDVNNDGVRDMLVSPNAPNVSENTKSILYYKNTGTNTAPNFIFQQNDFLQDNMIDVGEGAYPVFFDFDADGLTDLLIGNLYSETGTGCVGTQNSSVTAYKNIGTPANPKFKFITSDYAGLLSAMGGVQNLMLTFGDLDNDGDPDMIVGDANGNLHYFKNTAGSGNPAVFALQNPFNMLDSSAGVIDIGSYAAPQLFDMDGDSLLDLVVGTRSGELWYYRNVGTAVNPAFALVTQTLGNVDVWTSCCTGYSTPFIFKKNNAIEMYVGSEQGHILHYTNISNNLAGTFTKADSMLWAPGEVWEGMRIALSGKDVTGDGLMDLVVGNYRGGLAFYKGDLTVGTQTIAAGNFDFEVFPNPADGMVYVKLLNACAGKNELSLYDELGRTILRREMTSSFDAIDVSGLACGIYYCMAGSACGREVRKVVVERR